MPQFDVVILPTFAHVENWRKQHADERSAGLFAQTVTTFDAWIADLWELHGDGRVLVGDVQRAVLMQVVFERESGNENPSGLASLAASFMREVAGVEQFQHALRKAQECELIEGLSNREVAFLRVLVRYEDALSSLGLVEPGEACACLAQRAHAVFPRAMRVLMSEAAAADAIQSQFFSSCDQLDVTVEPAIGADGIPRAPEGTDVRFAFPAGRLAQPGLVADEVAAACAEGDVVVACKDPLAMFADVRDRLAGLGLHICAQARKPFMQTDFGKAFLAMHQCLHADPWNPTLLTDVLLSPFSGFAKADAFQIDKLLIRADRVLAREGALAGLRAQSEPFSRLEEIASDPDADVLIGVFEQMVLAMAHRSQAWRAEQLAAMGTLREATSAARKVGADIRVCADVLRAASVPVAVCVAQEGPRIVLTTLSVASRMQVGCCNTLIVTDLTAEDYPVANRDDSASTLIEKLGITPGESALTRARREFSALCRLPRRNLVAMRPLGDDAADATYPAAVLEEFIDAYRDDPSATEDIDNEYRLPGGLQNGIAVRGEELLYANERAAAGQSQQAEAAVVPLPRIDDAGPREADPDAEGFALAPRRLSPSQLEVYLECPYQWFATRRLRIQELDEGFGPLERGTFAHAALEAFYRRFQEAGHAKVDEGNIDEARNLMKSVTAELMQGQFAEEPGGGRLVYATELERREVEALCEQLVAYLDFESALLPTFHPVYLEYAIDADQAVEYAGMPLVGKVDRIDVDDAGNAVIIDYKGSVNAEHAIADKNWLHAGKVQTRIYAQVIKRALGLNVVGALYVSYGRRPAVAGSYDPRVIEAPHLPGTVPDKGRCGTLADIPDSPSDDFLFADLTFDRMLDATEALAAEAVTRMVAGDIAPQPSVPTTCAYCPVLACPKRGA